MANTGYKMLYERNSDTAGTDSRMEDDEDIDVFEENSMMPLNQEEQNYTRFTLLVKGVGPKVVKFYFDQKFPPNQLKILIQRNYSILHDLHLKRKISNCQWKQLHPRSCDEPKSHQFDITLMVCLLRHIIDDIQVPRSGWDALPVDTDTTIGADLARIKWYRNFDAHLPNCLLGEDEFEEKWEDLTGAIARLGGSLMADACRQLRVQPLQNIIPNNIRGTVYRVFISTAYTL